MMKRQQVIALLALGWSFRRIERETGVRRETVSRYSRPADPKAAKVFPGESGPEGPESSLEAGEDAALAPAAGLNPAKVFPGSDSNPAKVFAGSHAPPRSSAAPYRDAILEKLELGLTVQRVYQDLQEEYGYAHSYESVKRYVRKLARRRRAVGVMHSLPGEEGQVDFFRGAPTLDATNLGGVVKVVRHDNLKAAVVRACLYDPDVNAVYEAFSKHWGFTALPTKPRNPPENGKQERSGGYVKSNALKGRRFGSLDEQNQYLCHWNRTIARLRIHGTTRKQVFTHYEETDKKALQPLAAEPFAIFERGTRTVHPDGHVEVDGAFYPVSPHLLGEELEVRWDARLVRAFHGETPVAVHARVRPGEWARRPGEPHQEPTSSQRAYVGKLIGTCARVGRPLQEWADAAYVERGVRALRLIQGALHLVRKHPREAVLHAAKKALANRLFRYKDLRRLTEQADSAPAQRSLLDVHEAIRPMSEYRLEDLL